MATAREGAPDRRSDDPNRWARASVVVAVGVIAFFVVTYVYNAVRFADDLIIGDQWYWVDNVLIPYEQGEIGLFDALTYEYASLSHSHIPTLAVFLFSYEFFGLTLAIDRVIGVLALSGLLGIVFVEANRHLGRRDALLTTAVVSAIVFASTAGANFAWSLLQFQLLYTLIAVVYLRTFVTWSVDRPLVHAAVAVPATLLLGDAIGVGAVVASLVFVAVSQLRRGVDRRPLAYLVSFPVSLAVLDALFRGERSHASLPFGDFLERALRDPLEVLEGIYFGLASSMVAPRAGAEETALIGWDHAYLWFIPPAAAVITIGVVWWRRRPGRESILPGLFVMTGLVWIMGVIKARSWLQGPEALQAPRYAMVTSIIGVGLVLLVAYLPLDRRAAVARWVFAVVVVAASAVGTIAVSASSEEVDAQDASLRQARAYALDGARNYRGGFYCAFSPCLRADWFLLDTASAMFDADDPAPPDWAPRAREIAFSPLVDADVEQREERCAAIDERDDDALLAWAAVAMELGPALDEVVGPDDPERDVLDRIVVRALRGECRLTTEPR